MVAAVCVWRRCRKGVRGRDGGVVGVLARGGSCDVMPKLRRAVVGNAKPCRYRRVKLLPPPTA
jgi:hypothetical protein